MKAPLIVGLVFCLGVGLGVGWKLGYLPLEFGAPPVAAIDDTEQAEEDVWADSSADEPVAEIPSRVVPSWAVTQQDEPPVEEGLNQKPIDPTIPARIEDPELDKVPVIRAEPKVRANSQASAKPYRRPPAEERVRPANYQDDIEDEKQKPREPQLAFDDPADKPVVASDRFAEIDEKLAAGEFLAAHKQLSKMYWSQKRRDDELHERLDATAKKIFFSPQPHFIEPHVVQAGDQLRKISGKYNLSWEYLATLNQIDPKRIREGQKLKVLKGPFAAIVSLHEFALTIHLQGYYVKRYQVGIGKDGTSPIGKFKVLEKVENPQYTDPDGRVIEGDDPKNPLGERWIDLGNSYGIHGTIEPDSIGKAASRGCIRLRDADIIEVYNFLVKDSVVEIRE